MPACPLKEWNMSNVIFGKFRSLEEAERDADGERRRMGRISNIALKAKDWDTVMNKFIEQNKKLRLLVRIWEAQIEKL
jgi:hypothetical protein